jgi:hypothetical protein
MGFLIFLKAVLKSVIGQNGTCLELRWGERGKGEGGEQCGEMTQTMYAHVNK